MTNTVLQPTIGLAMLIMLGFFLLLALRQRKNVTSLFKYHLYGDDLKENRFSGSLISTNASLSGAFLLILYYGFLYGPLIFPLVWSFWLITQLTSVWTIQRTHDVLEAHGGWHNNRATIHEFIGMVFKSSRARRYAGILSLCSYTGLIAAEIVLATHLLTYLFPNTPRIPLTTINFGPFGLIIVIMLSILVYNFLSGFRGTVQTDFSQAIIMALMIAAIGLFVIATFPTWWAQYTAIFSAPSKGLLPALLNPDHQGYVPFLSFALSNIFFWGLWWPGAMDQWQRCAAGKTRRLSLNSLWGTIGAIPVVYFGALTAVFLFAGVWLRVRTPDLAPTPELLRKLILDVHQWASAMGGSFVGLAMAAVVFLGLVCAAMSTIDSYVMTASQTFFVDIVNSNRGSTLKDLDAQDSDQLLLTQARAFTVFIPLMVTVCALAFALLSDVYSLIYFAFSFMFAILPPLFVGLIGKARPSASRACENSLLAGGISCVIGYMVIIVNLERALRANDAAAISRWYQLVYWWPAIVTVVGAVVLWIKWPRRDGMEAEADDRVVA